MDKLILALKIALADEAELSIVQVDEADQMAGKTWLIIKKIIEEVGAQLFMTSRRPVSDNPTLFEKSPNENS